MKKTLLKTSALPVLCSIYSSLSFAAPVPEVLRSSLTAGYPVGSTFVEQKSSFSEDGRFFLVRGHVYQSSTALAEVSKVFDLYTNRSINLLTAYPNKTANAISASGRYLSTFSEIIDLKFGVVNSLPTGISFNDTINPMSDNGRYVTYRQFFTGYLTHGYVYDRLTGQSTLGTPFYGTSYDLVPATFNGFPNDLLLSGDGKVLFWGTDGVNAGYAPTKPNMRDLIAYKWSIASNVNPRVSNCNNCGDTSTTKGSGAYNYDVSADGNIAVFRSPEDFGFATAGGQPRNGASQIYARNLTTLKVDLISGDDLGNLEDISPATNVSYYESSISSDGRFVVFSGGGKSYIRDRFAKKKQLLDATAYKATISGNGKSILLERSDGWYSLPNPYLVTTTDFTSNYLFVNVLMGGNVSHNFDHMLLTGNNTWTGYLDYTGTGSSSIKIAPGGHWDVNGNYVVGSSAPIGFGDNNADGIAAFGETPINLTQGAGRYKITFNDQTNQYTVKKLASVNMSCYNGYTTAGQSVYVIGNIPELGNWSPANAVKLNPTSYPSWTGALDLPTNTAIEWKCIKRDELNPASSLVWENGANNQFNPSSVQTTDGHF